MLPHSIYEIIPYLYLVSGLILNLLSDSPILDLASVFIAIAGLIVLVMRFHFRNEARKRRRYHEYLLQAGSVSRYRYR